MKAEELKLNIKKLLGDDVVFNKDFDKYVSKIKNIESSLIEFCNYINNKELQPIFLPKKDSILFIKKIGSSNRCVVIKIVNGKFTEFHLGDHAYYDKLRKRLGLKKDNKKY